MADCIALIQTVAETGECVWNMGLIGMAAAAIAGLFVFAVVIHTLRCLLKRNCKKLDVSQDTKIFCPECQEFVKTMHGKCPYCDTDLSQKGNGHR